jgi:hypothetical protein
MCVYYNSARVKLNSTLLLLMISLLNHYAVSVAYASSVSLNEQYSSNECVVRTW